MDERKCHEPHKQQMQSEQAEVERRTESIESSLESLDLDSFES